MLTSERYKTLYATVRIVLSEKWVMCGTQNATEHVEVRLETWSLNQDHPEGTTYRFNTILPGINTIYFFRSQIGT